MEFIRVFPEWKDFGDEETRAHWSTFRNPVKGRQLIIDQNLIMGPMIEHGARRGFSLEELVHYRKPFLEPSSREVIYMWTTQIPIAGTPEDVIDIATRYEKWLLETKVPKLFFYYENAPLVNGDKMRWYMERLSNAKSVDVGDAGHFLQEDYPALVAQETRAWLDAISPLR